MAPIRHPGHACPGLLSVLAAHAAPPANPDPHRHAYDNRPIALTTPEIRRLFIALLATPKDQQAHLLRCSSWRRHHQGQIILAYRVGRLGY